MGDNTGLAPRAFTTTPCCYCGSSGHLPEWCTHRAEPRRPRAETPLHAEATGRAVPTREPRPKTELRRVTVCEHDERLEVKSVRGVGFSWRCTCGARMRRYGSRDAALAGKHEHELTHRRVMTSADHVPEA